MTLDPVSAEPPESTPPAASRLSRIFGQRLSAGVLPLALGLAVSLFAAVATLIIQQEISTGFSDLRRTRDREALAAAIMTGVTEAQSDLRGYVATALPEQLERARSILASLSWQLAKLHDDLRADPELAGLEQETTPRIRPAIERMHAASRLGDGVDAPDREAQLAALAEIRPLVETARNGHRQLIDGLRSLLATQRAEVSNDISSLVFAALLLLTGALLTSFNQTRRLAQEVAAHFRRQAASDRAIAGLSERVTQSRAELAETNRRLGLALRAARVAVFAVNADGAVDWLSADKDAPISPANLPGRLGDLAHPGERGRVEEALASVFRGGQGANFELRVAEAFAPIGWLSVNIDPKLDGVDGRALGSAVDITELKRREEGNFWLMRELSHRSKNLLAVVQAISRQTVRTTQTSAAFHERFSARLRALAAAHDLFVKEAYRGAEFAELFASQIGMSEEYVSARIDRSGPSVWMRPEAAQNFAMALHELAANALKYGALSGPNGRVEARWRVEGEGAAARFLFDWTEHGGPPPAAPRGAGFGTALITHNLPRSINGVATLTYAPDGVRCHVEAPMAAIAPSADTT